MLYVKPDYGNDYSGHLGNEKVPSFCTVLRFPFFQTQGYIFYLFALMGLLYSENKQRKSSESRYDKSDVK